MRIDWLRPVRGGRTVHGATSSPFACLIFKLENPNFPQPETGDFPLRRHAMNAAVASNTESVQVTPLSAFIGAEINGVDLTQPLEGHQISQIRAALLKWRVIFFREQFLTHAQHVAFSAQFGELTLGHPVFGHVDGHPEIYSISKYRKATRFEGQALLRPWTGWHTDVTAAVNPPFASILRGVTIPPYGANTQWTNLVAAYQKLSAPLRTFVDGL